LCRIVNFSIDGGIEYLVILGTTAETYYLKTKGVGYQTVVDCNKDDAFSVGSRRKRY
jgi:4-hydroxy-tetrahydrodipicolinate synthase